MTKTNEKPVFTRRSFLKTSSSVLAGACLAFPSSRTIGNSPSSGSPVEVTLQENDVILFQGDSITDAGRNRNRENNPNDSRALGSGYALIATSQLLAQSPRLNLKFYNRGISGNKVCQLQERWQKDCLDLKPQLLSILIGVNDFWHTQRGTYQGSVEKYAKDYQTLLEMTSRQLPQTRLIICEPFLLPGRVVDKKWPALFGEYQAAAKKLAQQFQAVFIPFQHTLTQAVRSAPPEYWAYDGVHPTPAGAYLMAQTWLKYVRHTSKSHLT